MRHGVAPPGSNGKPQPLGYTKSEGKGRVAYLANGHDPRSLTHPTVKQLVERLKQKGLDKYL